MIGHSGLRVNSASSKPRVVRRDSATGGDAQSIHGDVADELPPGWKMALSI